MQVYPDKETLVSLFTDLWNEMLRETDISRRLTDENISVLFKVTKPDAELFADAEGLLSGENINGKKPELTLIMSGDTVHKFWLNKLNVAGALALRRIKTKGPVSKALKMLPWLKYGHQVYPAICRKYGIAV